MAKERISNLQREILKALLQISIDRIERGISGHDDASFGGYPSFNISLYLTSKVADKYYDQVLKALGTGARYLKNILISRKASVAIIRSLRNLHRKGLVELYEISQEVRLTEKGVEVAKTFQK